MPDSATLSLARIDRYVAEWIKPALYRSRHALDVSSWNVPDEPVPFAQARAAQYVPHPIGTPWGAAWGTVWFHVAGAVPAGWPAEGTRLEMIVDLGFIAQQPGFQAEGAAWSPDGQLVKGISPRNAWVPLPQSEGDVEFYIEAAANPDVPGDQWTKPTKMGDKATAGSDPIYRLTFVDLALVDLEVEALVADVHALRGLADTLHASTPRRAEILVGLERMCDVVDPDDVAGTASAGREVLAPLLAASASGSAHKVHAVGHAHIDSAWLWPVRETVRKVSRTVANVLALMDADPEITFAFSSAQQYAWIQEYYPELFERLAARVREGRINPVGGMWVESDTNMVGSEALVRQFVQGKRFFIEELGVEPNNVWLPDSFGYTGAFPQIALLAGCDDFLTQKLSWNDTNRMPHHTFWWEGIDGTRVFTHFPPIDTYNSNLGAVELQLAETQFSEKGHANTSLAPYGYGDGGGGPTREMVAQGHRAADLEGSPRVILSTPQGFFDAAREEFADRAPTWVGEMYLEYHRGTYTSQSRTKRGNRRSEHLLREAELWATTASVRLGVEYPYADLQRLWRLVLLQQFHDILPGTSIAWVHRETERVHEDVARELNALITDRLGVLAGGASGGGAGAGAEGDAGKDAAPSGELVVNASPYGRGGVPGLGVGVRAAVSPAVLTRTESGWLLENEALSVLVDERGLVTSAVHRRSGREAIPAGTAGNLLQLHQDIPNTWEAWDIDSHYRHLVEDLTGVESIEEVTDEHGQPGLRIVRSFSNSRVEQVLSLAGGDDPTLRVLVDVDWHEQHRLLKLAFPLDVLADHATSETQFGHVSRSTHANTSWDTARFETVAHRWVHVGEPGFGVSVANDGTYGHDITRIRTEGGVASQVRLSLLRGPLFPDPVADQGEHRFRYAVTVGADVAEAVKQGYALNLPERVVAGSGSAGGFSGLAPLVASDSEQIVVEAVKLAEDASGDVIVRVYEAHGTRGQARLALGFDASAVVVTDLLERALADDGAATVELVDGGVALALRPFQVLTLRFTR